MNAIKSIIITVLSVVMVFANIFGPYYLINIFPQDGHKVRLGIHYSFGDTYNIEPELYNISVTGFKVVKIFLDYVQTQNNQSILFFDSCRQYNLSVAIIVGPEDVNTFNMTLDWIEDKPYNIDYIQILNEPELANSWAEGALYIDNELQTMVKQIHSIVKAHDIKALDGSPVKTYVNFSPAFLLRPNIVQFYLPYVDFIGYDAYTSGFIQFTPELMMVLSKLVVDKKIIISEFGMNELDDKVQADHIIEQLNFFKNSGFSDVWLCYWGESSGGYNIANRLAQEKIKDWVSINGI